MSEKSPGGKLKLGPVKKENVLRQRNNTLLSPNICHVFDPAPFVSDYARFFAKHLWDNIEIEQNNLTGLA